MQRLVIIKSQSQLYFDGQPFDFVFGKIDQFFNETTVSTKDEIVFTFNGKTYTTISKVLIITK